MSWHIPVNTPHMESQSKHAPSMDYAKDIYKVASTMKDFNALEIGGAWGFSTLAILEAGAKTLLTVDPNVLIEAPNEAKVNGYTNYAWSCIRSDKFWQENTSKFELIYIDGSHLYDDVRNDLYEAWKVLADGGLLMIDDWEHKNNIIADSTNGFSEYGVSLACWEFWRDHYSEVKNIGIEGRVLWLKK